MDANRIVFTGVPQEHIPQVWPHYREFVVRACDASDGVYGPDDILALCAKGELHLWVIADAVEEAMRGIVVTQFVTVAGKVALLLLCAGGDKLDTWMDEVIDILDAFAFQNGADCLRVIGRKGWERKLKSRGFEHKATILQKELGSRH